METLFVKKKSDFIFLFLFLLHAACAIGQIDTILQLPCPVGGSKTTVLSGELTQVSKTSKKPIIFNGCNSSTNEYPYQVFRVKIPAKPLLRIENYSDVDVSIYSAKQNVEMDVCIDLIYHIKSKQMLELTTLENEAWWSIVVHANSLNQYPTFSIDFSEEISVFDDECSVKYYKVCERDTVSQPIKVIEFNPLFDGLVREDVQIDVSEINKFGSMIKTYIIEDRIVGRSEHIVFKAKMVDFPEFYSFENVADFSLSCQYKGSLDPVSIYSYLKETVGDSLAKVNQWPGMFGTHVICGNIWYSYTDTILNQNTLNQPEKIKRTFVILNWENGDYFSKSQIITFINDHLVKVERLPDINTTLNSWECKAAILLQNPKLTSNCDPNYTFLKLYAPPGVYVTMQDDKYSITGIPLGTHLFYFVYDDGFHPADTSYFRVNATKAQGNIFTLPTFNINTTTYQINTSGFSQYIIDPCTNYELYIQEPITPCDTIDDGTINICCEMLENSDTYQIKAIFKEYRINESDEIVLVDSFIIISPLLLSQSIERLECPKDTTLNCLAQDWTPLITGNATAIGICANSIATIFDDKINVVNELKTLVSRTFEYRVFGGNKLTCTQEINLECTSNTTSYYDQQNLEVDIFPNPITDLFTLKVNNLDPISEIQFFDMNGNILWTSTTFNEMKQQYEVNTQSWPSNQMYYYKLLNANGKVKAGKVIKI